MCECANARIHVAFNTKYIDIDSFHNRLYRYFENTEHCIYEMFNTRLYHFLFLLTKKI